MYCNNWILDEQQQVQHYDGSTNFTDDHRELVRNW